MTIFFSKPELFQYFSQDLEMFIKKLAKEKRKFWISIYIGFLTDDVNFLLSPKDDFFFFFSCITKARREFTIYNLRPADAAKQLDSP